MKRTRADVEAEILATRAALIAADEEAAESADNPDAWTLGDILFDQLRRLADEVALIPHQRLPSDGKHEPPKLLPGQRA